MWGVIYFMTMNTYRLSSNGSGNTRGTPWGGRQMKVTHGKRYAKDMVPVTKEEPLLRSELGDVLRSLRSLQGRTLREVSSDAQVSLGYLSEVERGQNEASSELLESIAKALGVPLWFVLREVSDRMMALDETTVPDTIPDDLMLSSMAQMR